MFSFLMASSGCAWFSSGTGNGTTDTQLLEPGVPPSPPAVPPSAPQEGFEQEVESAQNL